jgi:predicted dinucleotide-binding enzyme
VRIGIIGAGHIGGTLAEHFIRAGHDVALSNSRGPATLGDVVAELGRRAQALTAEEAARFGDVVVVAVPFGRYRELPADGFAGRSSSTRTTTTRSATATSTSSTANGAPRASCSRHTCPEPGW